MGYTFNQCGGKSCFGSDDMFINNGVAQWKFQRCANLLSVIVVVALLVLTCSGHFSSYDALMGLVDSGVFKVVALISLVVFSLNSILAGWQIAGDYAAKINVSGSLVTLIIGLISVAYMVAGVCILF
jgi:succinate dehydrogenase / fumarate reductase, membrane anchor subunit